MNEVKNIKDVEQVLIRDILRFVNGRMWEVAVGTYGILATSTSSQWRLLHDGQECFNGGGETSLDETRQKMATIRFLRDHLLQTTGRRIWGLTLTLYPDGKFNIEYDYNKPPYYEEDDEAAAAPSEAAPVADLLGGLLCNAVNGTSGDQTPETQRLSAALTWLQRQTAEHSSNWGLGSEANWNLDMNEGWLRWSFADGRVLQAAVQVIGTYNTKNNSFMWGWDHPSVPEPLRRAAQQMHTLGQELGNGRWTTRTVDCTEDEAWQFTALAAQQDGAAGAYRGNANGTWVYMSFAKPSIDSNLAKDLQP